MGPLLGGGRCSCLLALGPGAAHVHPRRRREPDSDRVRALRGRHSADAAGAERTVPGPASGALARPRRGEVPVVRLDRVVLTRGRRNAADHLGVRRSPRRRQALVVAPPVPRAIAPRRARRRRRRLPGHRAANRGVDRGRGGGSTRAGYPRGSPRRARRRRGRTGDRAHLRSCCQRRAGDGDPPGDRRESALRRRAGTAPRLGRAARRSSLWGWDPDRAAGRSRG
jgi:hypothetical protein